MKKFAKYRVFSTIDLPKVLSGISMLILMGAVTLCVALFVSENFNTNFVAFSYALATKTPYTPSSNFAEAIVNFSIPTASFTTPEEVQSPIEPIGLTQTKPLPIAQPLTITYESASEEGYKSIDGIYINNQSGKNIDMESLLNKKLNITLTDGPSVLIIHTHTTESYTPSEKYNYTPTETDRTTDENFNMIAVGEVIYKKLSEKGVNVIHDKTVNDQPSYSQSYSKSLKLIKSYMEKYPSIKIVIDVHRDAITDKNGNKVRPITAFDPASAQVMLVVGTNASGLTHPDWSTNLSFALKLQYAMNSHYPTLARPINLRRERFNQHLAPYSFILEVGSNGNRLEEAKKGAEYFSESLIQMLKL